jgi:cysteine desulfurase
MSMSDISSATRSYLDHNATVPVRPEVVDAVGRALLLANPSSVHNEGRAARAAVEQARNQVAALARAEARNVIFTSGGTEASVTVLTPTLTDCSGKVDCQREPATLLLVSATEHACVRDGHRFPSASVDTIPVDGGGLVDLTWLEARLARLSAEQPDGRALVSVHAANNETGVIQPIEAIANIAAAHGALLHVDAVQAAGRIALDINTLGADVLTLSAHKLGGPKGVGAIVFRNASLDILAKPIRGGGQERGWRGGTENVAGIVGFGVAAASAMQQLESERARLRDLRDRLEAKVLAARPATVIFGADAPRLPNTSALAMAGAKAETLLILLDLAGISVSSGSACSSGKVRRSHVLEAMGIAPELSEAALRISLGWTTTADDIDRFVSAYAKATAALVDRRAQAAA